MNMANIRKKLPSRKRPDCGPSGPAAGALADTPFSTGNDEAPWPEGRIPRCVSTLIGPVAQGQQLQRRIANGRRAAVFSCLRPLNLENKVHDSIH